MSLEIYNKKTTPNTKSDFRQLPAITFYDDGSIVFTLALIKMLNADKDSRVNFIYDNETKEWFISLTTDKNGFALKEKKHTFGTDKITKQYKIYDKSFVNYFLKSIDLMGLKRAKAKVSMSAIIKNKLTLYPIITASIQKNNSSISLIS